MVPFTLVIIFVLLYLTFRSLASAALIMGTLPFAVVGGFWLLYLLGYNLSIASAIGFIALAGVAAEFGVIMLLYLDHAIEKRRAAGQLAGETDLIAAIDEGAVQRVRPKAMTVAVIIAGLLPIMFGGGTGSEVMRRIAAPMVGGMITAPILSMLGAARGLPAVAQASAIAPRSRRREHCGRVISSGRRSSRRGDQGVLQLESGYFFPSPLRASISACIRRLYSAAQSPAADVFGAPLAGNTLAAASLYFPSVGPPLPRVPLGRSLYSISALFRTAVPSFTSLIHMPIWCWRCTAL